MDSTLTRRGFIGLGLAGIAVAAEEASLGLIGKRLFSTIEDVLKKYAAIETVAHGSKGNFFLVGMEHFYAATTQFGKDRKTPQSYSLPAVQSEIYGLLRDLSIYKNIRLVVGEGFMPGEVQVNYRKRGLSDREYERHKECMRQHDFKMRFFKANPNETGYTALELFEPDTIRLYGVDDAKERNELERLERELFSAGLRYVPRTDDWKNSERVREFLKVSEDLEKKKQALNDSRSRIYLKSATEIADRLGEKDVVVVIGNSHVPLMKKEYHDKRTLYVLRPKSLS